MSNRSIRKVRHYKPAPPFKELVHAGVAKQTKELWARYGWGEVLAQPVYQPELEVVVPAEHVHGEHCNHDHE